VDRPGKHRMLKMTGTASQIEWAEQIRPRVAQEFDRVANAFKEVADRQTPQDRAETGTVLAILEEKRAETMAKNHAGYFIRDWQELDGRVRLLIAKDPRYQVIQAGRAARKNTKTGD
jgi:hypothetical protein